MDTSLKDTKYRRRGNENESIWMFDFKTLSGKFHAANSVTLKFVDQDTETAYEEQALRKSVPVFYLTNLFGFTWIYLLMIFYKLTGHLGPVPAFVYFIPGLSVIYGIVVTVVLRPSVRKDTYQYAARLLFMAQFFYCDIAIILFTAGVKWMNAAFPSEQIQWIAALSIGVAVTMRRSISATLLAFCLTFVLDSITSYFICDVSMFNIATGRWTILATTFITLAIYMYQSEYGARLSFLNECEYESWKIKKEELRVEDLIGSGTYGEVYSGQWRGYQVAIKKILAKNESQKNLASKTTTEEVDGSASSPEKSLKSSTGSLQSIYSRIAAVFKMFNGSKTWRERMLQARNEARRLEEHFVEFEREIRTMLSLRHPNIVTFMGACMDKPDMLLITEFCTNGSLFDFLVSPIHKQNGIIELGRKIDFCVGTANGLRYLHSLNPPILHRDFKSLNILIDSSFVVKICDFGLCDFSSVLKSRIRFKKNGTRKPNKSSKTGLDKEPQKHRRIVGTIPWVAPEIFNNETHTEKSDIFSLGIVMWEIFAEKHPYIDELQGGEYKVADLIEAIVTREYRPRVKKNLTTKLILTPTEIIETMRMCWSGKAKNRPEWNTITTRLLMAREKYKEILLSPTREGATLTPALTETESTAPLSRPTSVIIGGQVTQEASSFTGREKIISIVSENWDVHDSERKELSVVNSGNVYSSRRISTFTGVATSE